MKLLETNVRNDTLGVVNYALLANGGSRSSFSLWLSPPRTPEGKTGDVTATESGAAPLSPPPPCPPGPLAIRRGRRKPKTGVRGIGGEPDWPTAP